MSLSRYEEIFRLKRKYSRVFEDMSASFGITQRAEQKEEAPSLNFEQAIYNVCYDLWADSSSAPQLEVAKQGVESKEGPTHTQEDVKTVDSEKIRTLKSLQNFAQEKIQNAAKTDSIAFRGGELKVQRDQKEIKLSYSENLDFPGIQIFEEFKKLKQRAPLKVAFIGDIRHDDKDDLLGKMIAAMNLTSGEFARGPLPLEHSDIQEDIKGSLKEKDLGLGIVVRELLSLRPKVLVTLGAKASHMMLDKKERMSRVHGCFKEVTLEGENGREHTLQVVPVFHPDFLRINPNMKKAAWNDLQKIMKYLPN